MQLPARPNLSDKMWWRDEVLLEIQLPTLLESGPSPACSAAHLALLQYAAQMGIAGIWFTQAGLPDPPPLAPAPRSHSVDELQPPWEALAQAARGMGLRTLSTRTPYADDGRRRAVEPGQLDTLPGHPGNACELHAQLSCHLKASPRKWPMWHLPSADVLGHASLRQCYSTMALQLSVRGTPIFRSSDMEHLRHLHYASPAHGQTHSPCMLEAYARMVRWRRNHAALVCGTMKLLPVHAHLLCFVREHQGRRILCVFNWSERYVRAPLLPSGLQAHLIPGSLLEGGRIVNHHIDCDPWGGFFAALNT